MATVEPTPPGWYPDPTGSGLQRWFDGVNWSATTQSATPPRPISSANPTTRFAWLMVAAPVSILIELLVLIVTGTIVPPEVDDAYTPVEFSILVIRIVGWLAYPALAFLDSRELRGRGLVPFAWGWGFLPVVYIVGRAIRVYGQTRRGLAPLFSWIGAYAAAQLAFLIAAVVATVSATG